MHIHLLPLGGTFGKAEIQLLRTVNKAACSHKCYFIRHYWSDEMKMPLKLFGRQSVHFRDALIEKRPCCIFDFECLFYYFVLITSVLKDFV